jgi:DNA-binding SARP family transcriptional activator
MIALRTLGTPEVKGANGSLLESVMGQPKRLAMLVYLAVAGPGRSLSRDQLIGLFWPEHDEGRARSSLRSALYALKKDLGPYVFVTPGSEGVGLNSEVVWCDVWTFDSAVTAGRLEEAVVLYKAPFLSGFFLKGARDFDQWVDRERDRLARAYAKALERLADSAKADEDWDDAVEWTRRLATQNPYSTRVTLRFMEALVAAGDRAAALAYAERHSARLKEDLDAEPSPDVMALAEQLRKRPGKRMV